MEMKMCFPLLLLIISLSAAQLQTQSDNEILSHGKQADSQGREPTNASDHKQTCTEDIYAVLREMTGLLAEQRVEMRHLWRENEAQAAELINLKARTDVTENQVEALKRADDVKRVAFSAALLASGEETIGPFNPIPPLVYRYIITNIGNAYNPNTGLFVAPVRGAYHFEFHVAGHADPSHASGAVLVKNGEQICIAYGFQPSRYYTSANGATLLLEVGDVVFMRLWLGAKIYDSPNHHSTFSGNLLFPM